MRTSVTRSSQWKDRLKPVPAYDDSDHRDRDERHDHAGARPGDVQQRLDHQQREAEAGAEEERLGEPDIEAGPGTAEAGPYTEQQQDRDHRRRTISVPSLVVHSGTNPSMDGLPFHTTT